jgi:MazG family protein
VPEADISEALLALDALTRRLRKECPWDREQDERSIVAHTVEEAYELADAAHAGDDSKLLDELGDVLFQVYFLALLLEERGAGDLGRIAAHVREKLIRRHPHIFGDVEVADSAEVLSNWDAIKATEPGREGGLFGEVPENLPALLYARKCQRRAGPAGAPVDEPQRSFVTLRDELARLEAAIDNERPPRVEERPRSGESARPHAFEGLGDVLFSVVALARVLKLDPELALRAAAQRFREQNGES